MRLSFRIGRQARIPVTVHGSVLLLSAALAATMALVALPQAAPGTPAPARWATGLAVGVLLVASILAHECAHARVARWQRIAVRRIDVSWSGGSTLLADVAATPRAELLISAAGPAMSVALAGALTAAAAGTAVLHVPLIVPVGLVWSAAVNALLAALNLMPAMSLDGGQILFAVLWRRAGDRDRAMSLGVLISAAIGAILLAVGVTVLAIRHVGSGVCLILVAWQHMPAQWLRAAVRRPGPLPRTK